VEIGNQLSVPATRADKERQEAKKTHSAAGRRKWSEWPDLKAESLTEERSVIDPGQYFHLADRFDMFHHVMR